MTIAATFGGSPVTLTISMQFAVTKSRKTVALNCVFTNGQSFPFIFSGTSKVKKK